MSTSTNNWRQRQTEHCFYSKIVTDITTRNSDKDIIFVFNNFSLNVFLVTVVAFSDFDINNFQDTQML
jgi:hypothetical protein